MNKPDVSSRDRVLARLCELCPVCRRARHRQKGLAYALVKNLEVSICPFCQAYERVHGKKAHEANER